MRVSTDFLGNQAVLALAFPAIVGKAVEYELLSVKSFAGEKSFGKCLESLLPVQLPTRVVGDFPVEMYPGVLAALRDFRQWNDYFVFKVYEAVGTVDSAGARELIEAMDGVTPGQTLIIQTQHAVRAEQLNEQGKECREKTGVVFDNRGISLNFTDRAGVHYIATYRSSVQLASAQVIEPGTGPGSPYRVRTMPLPWRTESRRISRLNPPEGKDLSAEWKRGARSDVGQATGDAGMDLSFGLLAIAQAREALALGRDVSESWVEVHFNRRKVAQNLRFQSFEWLRGSSLRGEGAPEVEVVARARLSDLLNTEAYRPSRFLGVIRDVVQQFRVSELVALRLLHEMAKGRRQRIDLWSAKGKLQAEPITMLDFTDATETLLSQGLREAGSHVDTGKVRALCQRYRSPEVAGRILIKDLDPVFAREGAKGLRLALVGIATLVGSQRSALALPPAGQQVELALSSSRAREELRDWLGAQEANGGRLALTLERLLRLPSRHPGLARAAALRVGRGYHQLVDILRDRFHL